MKGFTANVIGYVPLSDDLNDFGKAGFYRFDQYLDLDGFGTSRQADGLTLGAGVRVAVADQASLRLEGEWYDLEDADFWTVNLGVDFYFGAP